MSNVTQIPHDDIVLLAYAMEKEGYSAIEIVQMVEKPWKWWKEIDWCKAHDGLLDGFEEEGTDQ